MAIEAEQFKSFDIEKEQLEKLKDLILTPKQYSETSFAQKDRTEKHTYVFEIGNENKKIVFFGTTHTNNPEDSLFEELKEEFDKAAPDMVYIEGWQSVNNKKDAVRDEMKEKTLEETKSEGEVFYTLKLAVDAGIDFECPEPDYAKEFIFQLETGFSKKDIFSYYMYRVIDQYQRNTKNPSFEECKEYLVPYITRFRKYSSWNNVELDLLEKELFSDLDVEDTKKYYAQVSPSFSEGKEQTVVNEVARNSNYFRDRYILERIIEGLKKHDKLFVVYGSFHAVTQEPALRALFS